MNKCLSISIDKTKGTVFDMIQACITRFEVTFFLGEEKEAYIESYTYLDVPITRPMFSQ